MVQHIATNFTGVIPGVKSGGIPLNPKPENFKLVSFWKQGDWQTIRNNTKVKDFDAPILGLFMEDEYGNSLPKDVKDEVRGDLYGYWTDLYNKGENPKNYKDLGFTAKEDFRKTLEGKYPWLRLCYGHWKVKQLWINYLGAWKKSHPKLPSTTSPLIPVPASTPAPGPDHASTSAPGPTPVPEEHTRITSLRSPHLITTIL